MTSLSDLGQWIRANESLLSGMAAMLALLGAAVSIVGLSVGRWRGRGSGTNREHPSRAVASPGSARKVGDPAERGPAAGADPDEPLLAVLAFENLSSDPEMQFFSDGVSEEIIQRLARGARMRVISRLSSFQFRGERKAEAAAALACSHVLDGSIRRAEGRIRVTAHLAEVRSKTTLWSETFDRTLADLFAVQDEIAEQIARALDRTFTRHSTRKIDAPTYDLYLRAQPRTYAPNELRTCVDLLEVATQNAPGFAEAWGRLAYLRAWHFYYQPYAERPAIAAQIAVEATRANELDANNADAVAARLFVVPPFGRFEDGDRLIEDLRRLPSAVDGLRYVGYFLRTTGRIREALEETERSHRLDALDPMSANQVALARMAAGQVDLAIPVFARLVDEIPQMSFPVANLLRAHALREDWDSVDRLLALAEKRDLRELQEGVAFIRAKRDPSGAHLDSWRNAFAAYVARTGSVDVARLVYAAHLGLVDDAYQLAAGARLGPVGGRDDILGPDAYRTSLLFQAGMPELRRDPRFPRLCARLGLAQFWTQSGKWPDCVDELPYDLRAECDRVRDVEVEPFGLVGQP